MRIGFYNPYFDGFGGGERYTLTLASHWSKDHDVFLFWDDDSIRKTSERRFNIDLSRVKTTQNFFKGKNVLKKAFLSKRYDLIFFLSDGSIPTSFAAHNILHFQVPFPHIRVNPLQLRQFNAIVVNSEFTKRTIDQRIGRRAKVIYPPVDVSRFHSGKKENIILSVGRFSSYFQAKKLEVLIDAWKKADFHGWNLIIAGGLLPSDQSYFETLKNLVSSQEIHLKPNIPFQELVRLYSRASFYWHAAGFGEKDPQCTEHFGISTVESMASGCVPIVFNGGGIPEIVRDGKDGFLWNTQKELIEKTNQCIADSTLTEMIRNNAIIRAETFSVKRFTDAFDRLLKNIL